ncbi:armadillo-type protein [Massariosphaeria phaeospora]|uniref:Importin-95 n=1 Tax=Massariosphaeria phaeospora TaxID=100035 RepID=A0A7C8IHA9_9PLEO|nr:armadillo-type protein [Massariosphaeria phaeospora]
MDINQVLEGTLSPDAYIRQAAEHELTQAAETNFTCPLTLLVSLQPLYLEVLSAHLADDAVQPHVRTAAGLALKNTFTAREYARLRQVQERWLNLDPQFKEKVKQLALSTLRTSDARAGQSAAQFIASIAAIEVPRDQWPQLMPALVENVGKGSDHQKQASLTTIGFICDTDDVELREALANHSNAILAAVVSGALKTQENLDVRNAAISALSDSIEFVRSNFEIENDRDHIMQVICEATVAEDARIQHGAYGCLNRIMALYYDKMFNYMKLALFDLTKASMRHDDEDIAKLAVEFWCTVCEEEIAIEDDNSQAQAEGSTELRVCFNFARQTTNKIVPVLLELLVKVDEDADENEYNVSRAAYQCLQLWAQCVGNDVVEDFDDKGKPINGPFLKFFTENYQYGDWHCRDAAVSAFGAMMEGPDESKLDPIVKNWTPELIGMMSDPVLHVRDSAAYALGRVCEFMPGSIKIDRDLEPLIDALFRGLNSHAQMATSCCWALMNLAERFAGEPGKPTNPVTKFFDMSIEKLLGVTEPLDADHQLRTAAYEVMNTFILHAASNSVNTVSQLIELILPRIEHSIKLQSQVVSIEDKVSLEEMQASLVSVVMAIVQRLENNITEPQAHLIIDQLIELLQNVGGKSSVPDAVFAAISAVATGLEDRLAAPPFKFMERFAPFLYAALGNQEDPGLCSMAVGLVSDITRSLGEQIQPYCDALMTLLLTNLESNLIGNQLKPAILQCFGDIAQAIGPKFDNYLPTVARFLQQASSVSVNSSNFEMMDYVISLREGIIDAWDGCVVAMKSGGQSQFIVPYLDSIFELLRIIQADPNRTEGLLRTSCGVIGDLADAFPNGEFRDYFRHDFLTALTRETRANHDFLPRTRDTARWAREQIKRQVGTSPLEGLFYDSFHATLSPPV